MADSRGVVTTRAEGATFFAEYAVEDKNYVFNTAFYTTGFSEREALNLLATRMRAEADAVEALALHLGVPEHPGKVTK